MCTAIFRKRRKKIVVYFVLPIVVAVEESHKIKLLYLMRLLSGAREKPQELMMAVH